MLWEIKNRWKRFKRRLEIVGKFPRVQWSFKITLFFQNGHYAIILVSGKMVSNNTEHVYNVYIMNIEAEA